MTAPTLPDNVPVPANADELAEMFADPARCKPVFESRDTLAAFVAEYGRRQQGDGTDLNKAVGEETRRALAAFLHEHGAQPADGRVPDPQNAGPRPMLTAHKQATAYNPQAPGAVLDGEFTDAAEFIRSTWHLNPSPEAAAKISRLRNAFGSTVPADGGFLVPETLRSQLLQVALEMAVVRSRATVVPMETARVPIPMIDSTSNASSVFGGMIGYWTDEAAALTDSSASFGRVTLDAKKLTGLSAVPNELLADSLISFSALIGNLWPRAIAWYEDVAFVGGSGTGEPLGFLGNAATVAVAKETGQAANTIVYENITKMYSRMLPSSLNRAVWLVSPDSLPELFTMSLSVGTGGSAIYVNSAAQDAPVSIFGRPVIVSEKMNTLGTQGDIAFVDLSYYLVGDRQAMTMASSTDYKFGNDQTTFRIIQRVDGRPWIQSAITPQNGSSNTLSPFVELAVRA